MICFKQHWLSSSIFLQFNFIRNISSSKNSFLNTLLIKMPRDLKHVKEAQKQRQKIKEKHVKYIPGTVNLQILGSGSPGTPACVYLFTDQQRYLFNCGEGTQRLAHEHKTKLARLEHIFMTRNCWDRTGGLPGLCLTVQDAGVPHLSLHGPPGLSEIFKAMRRFVILKDLKVEAPQCDANTFYDDSVMTVFYVPLEKTENLNSNSNSTDSVRRLSPVVYDNTDYYSHENGGSETSTPTFDMDLSKQEEKMVMSYICKLKAKPGQLNLEKCVENGVPPGPLLGQLKNGNDVTLPNGTVVRAADVRAPDDPGPVFFIIDIPSTEYLSALESNYEKFSPFIEGNNADSTSLVMHFSPQNIIESEIYTQFIRKFPAKTQHLILNETNKFSGYVAAHRIQWQLNRLNEFVFPLLKEKCEMELNNESSLTKKPKIDSDILKEQETTKLADFKNLGFAAPLTCFHLRPQNGLDRSLEQILVPDEYIQESLVIPGFIESLNSLTIDMNKIYSNQIINRYLEYPKIVFLGTGSCIPNKTRNVSSILIHTNPETCILLDCGEGTAGQIIRFYGENKSREIFKKLKMVFVSHLHADHHIGLFGILQTRRRLIGTDDDKLLLLAPKQICSWLYFYDRRIESLKDEYSLIAIGDLLETPLNDSRVHNIGIDNISICSVRHCPHSFGISIELDHIKLYDDKPIKITYSGDTMPCSELVDLGKNSTILIHEATMEDELEREAKMKMHSTLSQAIDQGKRMNAKYTILTHFSQRYAKLPRIEENLNANVGIAFDNMEVTLMDLKHLHLLYPTLKLLFIEQCEEMEQKALKRAYKKQRLNSRDQSPSL